MIYRRFWWYSVDSDEIYENLLPVSKSKLESYFNISLVDFIDQKEKYDEKISTGEYHNFLDYLIEYNLLDCEILSKSMQKFIETFEKCFQVSLLDKLSLPGISEEIMWQKYDRNTPKIFSFDENFGFLNQRIRDALMGGPVLIFHRHCEITDVHKNYPKEVFVAKNNEKYTKLVSFDY